MLDTTQEASYLSQHFRQWASNWNLNQMEIFSLIFLEQFIFIWIVRNCAAATLYWQLGAVWSSRSTPELLSGRLVCSIPEISVTAGTLHTRMNRECGCLSVNLQLRGSSLTHLTVVRESSLNQGTLIRYTLGNRSADTNTPLRRSSCTRVWGCKSQLTFQSFALTDDINPESLVGLKTHGTLAETRTAKAEETMEITWWKCCRRMWCRSPEEFTVTSLEVKPKEETQRLWDTSQFHQEAGGLNQHLRDSPKEKTLGTESVRVWESDWCLCHSHSTVNWGQTSYAWVLGTWTW